MIPSAKIAAEQADHRVQAVVADLLHAGLDRHVVDTRRGHVGTHPVDQQHAYRKEDLRTQIGRAKSLREHGEHVGSSSDVGSFGR